MKTLKNFACWLWKSRKDFSPAYKWFFSKKRRKSKISPLKKGVMERAGGNAYRALLIRADIGSHLGVFILGGWVVILIIGLATKEGGNIIVGLGILLFLIIPVIWFVFTPVLLYQMNDYNLGHLGEREVADELEKLGRTHWRIFHNYDTGKGNIDHIIVCLKGVFCVETKAPRKRTDMKEQEKIVFENNELWINGKKKMDRPNPVSQSRRNAKNLHDYLVRECAGYKDLKNNFIPSIIAFPGWFVEIKHGHYNKDIIPCNSKTIAGIFTKGEDKLDGKMFDKICDAIETKNRTDVKDVGE